MITIHNLGYPRIGVQRELKFALESYWNGQTSGCDLNSVAADLRRRNWQDQSALNWVPVGDFSLYDQVLDTSFMLGNVPERVRTLPGDALDNYFRVARGRSVQSTEIAGTNDGVLAGEMTKWFDTNYHYIVPEFAASTEFRLNTVQLLEQLAEARANGVNAKPVLIGPVTYLALGKVNDGSNKLALLAKILPVYRELLEVLADNAVEWVQIDEPLLVSDLNSDWQHAFNYAYHHLKGCRVKLLLTTYFGGLHENTYLAVHLPVAGLHVDVADGCDGLSVLMDSLPEHKILSLGVISGRNIWKADLNRLLDWLEPVAKRLGDRLWLAPSCSLLHVPMDLNIESKLDAEIKSWLAFARQKLEELRTLSSALSYGRVSVQAELDANQAAWWLRKNSPRVHNPQVKAELAQLEPDSGNRKSTYRIRSARQAALLNLPLLPTTTIGSFPQTDQIRQMRNQFKSGLLDRATYQAAMRAEIAHVVRVQEELDLDVLVHGEAERNDMVEYFGEQLDGYVFSQFGWVQSYGSRCVKPPVLFGDVYRPQPMTVEWITYAQSLTQRPLKGMLTGPVTLLNWSFVRDDQPRSLTCRQLALAIRNEVLDLERAGVRIIQIDEAALREGFPLRISQWSDYLQWAIESFRIAANGVQDETQIHTHMCYSEFNDIIAGIAAMDADVITIETSRSNMELLNIFDSFNYPNQIGPGVYDIHTPNIPTQEQIVALMKKALACIPVERLWVNPDCGLKTRQWSEVIPALKNMVAAAQILRQQIEVPH